MKKLLPLTVAALLGFSTAAHASTLITLGATSSNVSYGAGAALTPDINIGSLSPAQLALTGDAAIETTSVSGQYTAPDGGAVYGGNYLAVIAVPTPAGTALYTPAAGQHFVSFTWGSVDPFNTLTITASNATYTFTGSTLASGIQNAGLGTVTFSSSDEDVIFDDTAGTITSLLFQSSQNSFEVANLGDQSPVPLPAALPLFGSALLAMGAFALRRKAI